ncbi:MAG TPA: hypothetical protein EYQ20_13590 [candidate division Zixibacteria bacterium]|nr:hypothetical protein [candidate division Zixibacteria bacterium]
MPFTFSEQHITEYYHNGYTVFQSILPSSLVQDLRRVTGLAREIIREENGPQVQRLQPVGKYADRLDMRPFQDYEELPELMDAYQRVLSPMHRLEGKARMGILFEPADRSWCTVWHRDITAKTNHVDPEEFAVLTRDATFFTQVNCALYTDISTWYVPASDGRPDTEAEVQASGLQPDTDRMNPEEAEYENLTYCRGMPGALQLVLEPGDFALYRPNAWHIGNYAPYRKRATLHDSIWKPETRAWYEQWFQGEKQAGQGSGKI